MGNRYIITVRKSIGQMNSWWGYTIEADDIDEAIKEFENSPEYWADCDRWEIIAVHKEWYNGGQMVMKVNIGRIF